MYRGLALPHGKVVAVRRPLLRKADKVLLVGGPIAMGLAAPMKVAFEERLEVLASPKARADLLAKQVPSAGSATNVVVCLGHAEEELLRAAGLPASALAPVVADLLVALSPYRRLLWVHHKSDVIRSALEQGGVLERLETNIDQPSARAFAELAGKIRTIL